MTFVAGMLGAAMLALVGLVAAELGFARDGIKEAAPAVMFPSIPSTARPSPAYAGDNDAWTLTALARPLLNPGRRPHSAPASSATLPASPPRLAGTVVSPAGKRAIFAASGKPAIAEEGDHIGAWTVQAISAGTVTLLGPGGTQELRVSFEQSVPNQDRMAALPSGSAPHVRTHRRSEVK